MKSTIVAFVEANGFRIADLLFSRKAEPDLGVVLAAVVVSGFLELFRLLDRLFVGAGR